MATKKKAKAPPPVHLCANCGGTVYNSFPEHDPHSLCNYCEGMRTRIAEEVAIGVAIAGNMTADQIPEYAVLVANKMVRALRGGMFRHSASPTEPALSGEATL